MKYRIICCFLLFISSRLSAQVSFIPEIYGRNVNGLFSCRITGGLISTPAKLTITVKERASGVICAIRTPEFNLLPGTNPIPLTAARSAAIQFSNNRIGQISASTRSFPEGDYEYCFSITFTRSDNPPVEQCFDYTLAPFAELNLIDPYNKDKICDKRPLLSWQPLLPAIPGALYQLVLAEVKSGQTPTEALNYNLALVNQSGIMSPTLPYPSIAKELENKKKYAWQVTAYKNQTILNRSEIWEFAIDCKDSMKRTAANGYRDIEDLSKGNFYIATGVLSFSFINAFGEGKLNYEIFGIDNPQKKIKHLPKLKIINGTNQIDIDLYDIGSFKNNTFYILKVTLPDGKVKNLRFIYREQP
ncbi:DUF928 domain-containing protein [Mucilaginibacter aquariorum]|uniref:DUF928 domain-containing protein n=1 Tax=Mucilaginibacter aquariorum TaxID=2967225 RepID=A0ABT1SYX1_9SPHI|nr:DUF928 domain-containing protein [Mucilaginibacter aquariorum]MCQ6957543.1 DUF928 domain-containing protein [Mucilaginibacter aquariorum]